MKNLKKVFKKYFIFRAPYMIIYGFKYYKDKIWLIFYNSFTSKEISTFNYSLTDFNLEYLIQTISTISGISYNNCLIYYYELINNQTISYKIKNTLISNFDSKLEFGGRILNYILIRAIKPKVIVENGVEFGVNSLLMCEAIKKNIEEGSLGEFIGIDINPNCGFLIENNNYNFSKIIIEDTIQFLTKTNIEINYYFSDGCRYPEYEKIEFLALSPHLNNNSIVISNKSVFSNQLSQFAINNSRNFITFKEEVVNHWYPGTIFGIVY